ncbi:MAG: AAA family ATPase, partial [bacterium]|nr:AAA family ATPase [bacterium]
MAESTFLERIRLHNYKSIAACEVELGPLTFLVGPNGAGKSNLLDALRLVSDALRTSLDGALRERGGIHSIERRGRGQGAAIGVRLDLRLRDSATGH